MAADPVVRVAQLAGRLERGSEEVLELLPEGPERVLLAAVRAYRRGERPSVVGLEEAWRRYDDVAAVARRVGGGRSGGRQPARGLSGRRSTRRHVPRSGRS